MWEGSNSAVREITAAAHRAGRLLVGCALLTAIPFTISVAAAGPAVVGFAGLGIATQSVAFVAVVARFRPRPVGAILLALNGGLFVSSVGGGGVQEHLGWMVTEGAAALLACAALIVASDRPLP